MHVYVPGCQHPARERQDSGNPTHYLHHIPTSTWGMVHATMSYNCELILNFVHVFVESSQIVLEHYRPFVANLKSLHMCICTNFECSMVVMISIRRGSISYPASLFTLAGLWEQKKTINTYYIYIHTQFSFMVHPILRK